MTLDNQARKARIAAFRERTPVAGIFALRCTASGQAWVGSAPDLATIANRHRFTLRQGQHRQRDLQQAWTAHGEAAFAFETVEAFADDGSAPASFSALQERVRMWAARLDAQAI
jgi:hypothetical protein